MHVVRVDTAAGSCRPGCTGCSSPGAQSREMAAWCCNADAATRSSQAISLALAALSFDFVGTCLDESSEDLGTIQVLTMSGRVQLVRH